MDERFTSTLRLLIHGASGRMGQSLLRLAAGREALAVVAAVSQTVSQRAVDGVPWFSARELQGVPTFDVAIDFSLPEGFDRVLALCLQRGVPLVSGTTGLSDAQKAALQAASLQIPLVWESNFSPGVAVLTDLVERAARRMQGWDCDIIEMHHRGKRDAPSGTALSLGAAAERGGAAPRFASVRAGDIIGEHCVQFATLGERVELAHRAESRDIFAGGALLAASRLAGRAPGAYRLVELID